MATLDTNPRPSKRSRHQARPVPPSPPHPNFDWHVDSAVTTIFDMSLEQAARQALASPRSTPPPPYPDLPEIPPPLTRLPTLRPTSLPTPVFNEQACPQELREVKYPETDLTCHETLQDDDLVTTTRWPHTCARDMADWTPLGWPKPVPLHLLFPKPKPGTMWQ